MNNKKPLHIVLCLILATLTSQALAVPTGQLYPAIGFPELASNNRSAVILIHGWNPPDASGDVPLSKFLDQNSEWPEFISALRNRLQYTGSNWQLQLYNWSDDAATGGIYEPDDGQCLNTGFVNAAEAVDNAVPNGTRLADLVHQEVPNLRRLVLIAHSAGSWVARHAAEELLQKNPFLVINVVLLDPFIPGVDGVDEEIHNGHTTQAMGDLASSFFQGRLFRLDNYNTRDITDYATCGEPPAGAWGEDSTFQTFGWESQDPRHLDPLRVDYDVFQYPQSIFPYGGHGGPIEFYRDTVIADTPNAAIPNDLWGAPDWNFSEVGFYRSLVDQENFLPAIVSAPSAAPTQEGNDVVLSVVAGSSSGIESYEWFWYGTDVSQEVYFNDVSGPTLTLENVAEVSHEGHYVVGIKNSYGYTFSEPVFLDVTQAPPPIITSVTPPSFDGPPLPQTTTLTIDGSGFIENVSRLIFNDGVNPPDTDIEPNFINTNRLTYDIQTDVTAATWTVQVDNNGSPSAAYEFYVTSVGEAPGTPGTPSASDGEFDDWIDIDWSGVFGADSYQVYRCTDTTISSCQSQTTTTSTFYTDFTAADSITYYYRIRACNVYGCSGYSNYDPGSQGSGLPPVPVSVSASDGTFSNGIVVDWPSVSGAASYKVYRATSVNGSRVLVSSGNSISIYADSNFVFDRVYWYWVKSCNSVGQCGGYSSPDSGFASESASTPGVLPPIDPDPADGESSVSVATGDLCWSDGGGASSYNVYFGTDSTPDSGEDIGWTPSDCKDIPTLDYSTTYYWRVDALADGETYTGSVWSFTTRDESAPDVPNRAINPIPEHDAANVSINANLSWESGGGGETSYDVYFGRDFQPGQEEFLGNTTSTTWDLPVLEYGRIYYWKVKARNAGGTAHGDIWKFRTEPPAPNMAEAPSPNDAEVDVRPASLRLRWSDPLGISKDFDVYFGTDPTPDSGEFVGNASQANWQTPELSPQTTYYWRVVSNNNAGTTSGPVWSFTTWTSGPGYLDVTYGGFSSQGPAGGPFSQPSKSYTLTNTGDANLDFELTKSRNWLSLSQASGTLSPGQTTTVVATFNGDASALVSGYHTDTISFENLTTGGHLGGSTGSAVSLAVDETHEPWDVAKLAKTSTDADSSFFIRVDGSLYAWGGNNYNELGLGDNAPHYVPAPVRTTEGLDWAEIAIGGRHALGVTTDGRLYAWGANNWGQLGLGDTTQRTAPTQVGTENDWISVEVSYGWSIALKSDGRMYTWGWGYRGQLGQGDENDRYSPTQVGTDSDWAQVHASSGRALAIKQDGRMYYWGNFNNAGFIGEEVHTPTQYGVENTWKKAVLGGSGSYYLALKTDGSLYAWGGNSSGQLGLGDFVDRDSPTRVGTDNDWGGIAAGDQHSMALKTDGRLYAWGYNYFFAVGDGSQTDRPVPTHVLLSRSTIDMEAGDDTSFALLDDGSVHAWGKNASERMELGLGYVGYQPYPVEMDVNWAANGSGGYTVTYEGNGNDGGTAPVDSSGPYDYDSIVTLLEPGDLSLSGHTFSGWNTQADGLGTNYAPGAPLNVVSNVSMYADWINMPPAANDDSATTLEDQPVEILVLSNDSDLETGSLEILNFDEISAQGGNILLNGDNSLTYTPLLDFFGNDAFTYVATDGYGGIDAAAVSVEVLRDTDGDGIPNDDDVDDDNDGMLDVYEISNALDPLVDDFDDDDDLDGVSNGLESLVGTDPQSDLSQPEGPGGTYVYFRDEFDSGLFADRWILSEAQMQGVPATVLESGTEIRVEIPQPLNGCSSATLDSYGAVDLATGVYRVRFAAEGVGEAAFGLLLDDLTWIEVRLDVDSAILSLVSATEGSQEIAAYAADFEIGEEIVLRLTKNGSAFDLYANGRFQGTTSNIGIGDLALRPYISSMSCDDDSGPVNLRTDIIELLADSDADGLADTFEDSDSDGIVGFGETDALNEDTDSDEVPDGDDNCSLLGNADQRDTNFDGFGNACDADLNNDTQINFLDLGMMKSDFFMPGDLDSDLNGDGSVNFLDLGIMKSQFFGSPGPSGPMTDL